MKKINEMTVDELREALTKQQDAARARVEGRNLGFKVGPKGTVCLFGFGRNPVTLYHTGWVKLLKHIEAVKRVVEFLDGRLPAKGETPLTEAQIAEINAEMGEQDFYAGVEIEKAA